MKFLQHIGVVTVIVTFHQCFGTGKYYVRIQSFTKTIIIRAVKSQADISCIIFPHGLSENTFSDPEFQEFLRLLFYLIFQDPFRRFP